MKGISLPEIEKTAIKAKKQCLIYGAELYIDDHVDICKNIAATGVHLGKQDMPPLDARKILGPDFIIGNTANTFEDIYRFSNEGTNYIGLGPFRFTNTKKNLNPILGLSGYRNIMQKCRENRINLPVIAIGGITANDIPGLIATGVSGIALSSSILTAKNPVAETKKIIDTINKCQK
jgi:thiamine-phosphate pyrophosphorylase